MKTKELIKLLQEADPDGNEEVCVDNMSIFEVYKEAAYYDGSLQILKTNSNGHISGGIIRRSGNKIQIRVLDLEEAVFCHVERQYNQYNKLRENFHIEVIGDTYNGKPKHSYDERIKQWHDNAIKIIESVRNKENLK